MNAIIMADVRQEGRPAVRMLLTTRARAPAKWWLAAAPCRAAPRRLVGRTRCRHAPWWLGAARLHTRRRRQRNRGRRIAPRAPPQPRFRLRVSGAAHAVCSAMAPAARAPHHVRCSALQAM
jgi:hypothetical protein